MSSTVLRTGTMPQYNYSGNPLNVSDVMSDDAVQQLTSTNNSTSTTPGVTPNVNPYTEYSNQIGLLGQTNGWWNNMGQAAGLAGTGIGIWNDTIGPKSQLFKTQMAAMKQNMANVAADKANHQTYVANIGGGFNSAFKPGSGLAASAPRVG